MAWEKKEGFTWTAWQAEQIRSLRGFARGNRQIARYYASEITSETQDLLQAQFDEALQPHDETELPKGSFFGVDKKRVNALIADIRQKETSAVSAALRMTDDVYRQTIQRTALLMSTGSVTLPQAVDMATKEFLSKGLTCVRYADGRRVNIADYAQTALRTASTRSKLQGEAERRKAIGIDAVYVSQYGACSDTCLPWQGRVYVDDVFADFTGERHSARGHSADGDWYPLLSEAVNAGLFHPNCRHTLTTYFKGMDLPPLMDAEKIKRISRLEQKQRTLKREVRRLGRLSEGAVDPGTAKRYRSQRAAAQKVLREFISAHPDELRRDPWREKTYGVPEMGVLDKTEF
jgi:hypothetical protein